MSAMSAVIEFPHRRIRKEAQAGTPGAAEVIIFPGVQIERLPFDLSERLPAVRSASPAQAKVRDFDFY